MAGRFTVEAAFKAIDQISGPVRKMRAQVAGFSDSAVHKLGAVDTTFSKMTGTIKTGAAITGAAMAGFVASAVSAKNVGAELEQTLVNAASKFPEAIGIGTKAFKELEDAARHVGSTTKFTASQAAEGLNFLAMAGFDAKQSIAALPGVVDLATAATMDLGQATDAATDILGAFNLTSKDSKVLGANLSRVNDVLAKTSTSTNTSVSQMYEAIKQSGAAAAASGTNIEQYSAMLGVLANSGTKGSEAGNALKNTFTRLMAPTDKVSKMLKGMGVHVSDSKGNMRNTITILQELQKGLSKFGNVEKMAKLKEIFGSDYVAPTTVLLRDIDQVKTLDKTLQNATGSASKMAKAMGNTTVGRELTLSSGVEGVKVSFFDAIKAPYNDFLKVMNKIVGKVDEWVKANKALISAKATDFFNGIVDGGTWIIKNFPIIKDVVKGVVLGFMGFYTVITIMKTVTTTLAFLNAVMMANPISLIIIGVGLLVAAFVAWNSASDKTKKAIIDFVNNGVKYISEKISSLLDQFYKWTDGLGTLGKVLKLAVTTAVGAFTGLLKMPMEIYKNWDDLPNYFKGLLGSVVDFFLDKFGQVKSIYSDIVKMFSSSESMKNAMGSEVVGKQMPVNYAALGAEFGTGSNQGGDTKPQIVSPAERAASVTAEKITKSVSESNSTLTIEDKTGKASLSGDKNANIRLKTATSGGFL